MYNSTSQHDGGVSGALLGTAIGFGVFVAAIAVTVVYNHFRYVCVVYEQEYPPAT